MECCDCIYHETFSDDVEGESFDDGCVCLNERAEKENRHLECCWKYGGKNKCPYKKVDDE